MLPQHIKDIYWDTVGQITRLNLYLQKLLVILGLRFNNNTVFLNLASGAHYIPGMVNIEGNAFRKKDLWLDVRHGLPFRSNSVNGIYMCHFIEHLPVYACVRVLKECTRILRPGCGVRIATPSLEKAISAYIKSDRDWFLPNWPDEYLSLGGAFNNYLLCRDQHRAMYDFSFVKELLIKAGFSSCKIASYGESNLFSEALLLAMEPPERRAFIEKSLVVEAVK